MTKTGSNIADRISWTDAIILLICGMASVFLTFQSDSSPLNAIAHGTDGVVFSYIGWGMSRGMVPYVGLWDNKGPLLYFIEYLGALLHPHYGIFVLELITLAITVFFLYKIARLFAGKWAACLATVMSVAFLAYYLEGGNRVEEFALPWVSMGMYLLIRGILAQGSFKWQQAAIVGACTAACVMIRVNLAAILLTFCLVVFVWLLGKKQWKRALILLPQLALGWAAAVMPFVIYLASKGALGECYRAAYTVLFGGERQGLYAGLYRMVRLYSPPALLMFALMCGFCLFAMYDLCKGKQETRKVINVAFASAFVLNLLANMIGPIQYPHYYLTNVLLYVYPLARVSQGLLHKLGSKIHLKGGAQALMTLLALVVCFFPARFNFERMVDMRRYPNNQVLSGAKLIGELTTPQQTVIGYGSFPGAASMIKASERLSGTRYIYSPVWEVFLPEFVDGVQGEIARDIRTGETQLLVLAPKWTQRLYEKQPGLEQYIKENYEKHPETVVFNEVEFEFFVKKQNRK